MIPAIVFYQNGGGITKPIRYAPYSLGNLGYSTSQCTSIPLEIGVLPAQCPFGRIGEIYAFGINPATMLSRAYCDRVPENKVCSD